MKKLLHDVDTSDEVVNLLAEIHNGEKAYMNRIFSSDPKTLRTMGSNLDNMREVFKKTTKSILEDVHGEDLDGIDRAFFLSLREYFLYWNSKIEIFMEESEKGIACLDHEHKQKITALNEHIELYVPMNKKPDKKILNYINAERRLCSLRENEEARMVRIKITDREVELQKKLMDERTLTIRQKKERILAHFEKERKNFLDVVENEWNKMVGKKHGAYDRLLVKYNKVMRVKDNVHHSENNRWEYLKSHKLDYKKPIHASKMAINQMAKKYFPCRKVEGIPEEPPASARMMSVNLATEVGPERRRLMGKNLTEDDVWAMLE